MVWVIKEVDRAYPIFQNIDEVNTYEFVIYDVKYLFPKIMSTIYKIFMVFTLANVSMRPTICLAFVIMILVIKIDMCLCEAWFYLLLL